MPDPTPETLRALEARLRQLFADLGVPADEAVELRADELAAVLDTAPPAQGTDTAEFMLDHVKDVEWEIR